MPSNLPVYVGVDGSLSSIEAADVAAAEAQARGTELVLLHVGPPDDGAFSSALNRVRQWHPSLEVSSHHHVAKASTVDPAAALADHATEGCLLIVGHRRTSNHRNIAAWSVAQRLVDISTVPIVVYRPLDLSYGVPEPRRILVGIGPDGNPDRVLDFALSEAARRGAPLDVICALPDLRADEEAANVTVADAVHRWFDKYPTVTASFHVRHGIDPAIALMVDSHTAQLVVVGAGSTSSRNSAASVAHALVHRAACPVAVIPTATDR